MPAVPEPLHSTLHQVFAAREREAEADGHRPHLGASIVGRKCDRQLWYTFRWAKRERFPGRLLRLFERGQMEEDRWWADLRRIGVTVHDRSPDGKQWRVTAVGGHFGGSMDAAVVGLPEAPKTWHVAEVKTHNAKSFADLQKKGVRSAKPEHWSQMQAYMHLTGMDRAVYLATNKDTDDLYVERIEHDADAAEVILARAERIITAPEPPARISADPSWYECKLCSYASVCHGTVLPEVNCRTCAHATPVVVAEREQGLWDCARHGREEIPVSVQRTGCNSHRYIPVFIERVAMQVDVRDGDVVYRTHDGEEFINGEAPGALTSEELRALDDKASAPFAAERKAALAGSGIDAKVVS